MRSPRVGGDVACGVEVGVAPASSAGIALEGRLGLTVPGCDVPAAEYVATCTGRDLRDPAVSLMLQTLGEKPTTAALNGGVSPLF